ncbi:MAG: EamA family transporter RarD [Myxococcota bacterium]
MRHQTSFAPAGVAFALGAYAIWGLTPLYWKALAHFPAPELLAHRVLWSCATGLALVWLLGARASLRHALGDARRWAPVTLTGLVIGLNWLVFLWAVIHDQVLATSLGYYITPLVNVLLGVLVLGERLRPLQIGAVSLAALGIGQLALELGELPWVTLVLALSFAFYGLIRKTTAVEPVAGFALETLVLLPLGAAYLAWLGRRGDAVFLTTDAATIGLVSLSGIATAAPLILFNAAARRLPLSTLGFFQYIAPSITFVLAVLVFGEPFRRVQLLAFASVWVALVMFSLDSFRASRADPTAAH